jgi:hypothetical protein
MKKLLLVLLALPLIGFGQSWPQIGSDINGEAADDESGASVSLSADGTTLAIGAPNNDGNGSNSGHVRVYKNVAGTWSQIGSDINGEATLDYSGSSVSLSADGATLAIGATGNNGGTGTGHVRVYQNVGGTWSQIGSDIDGEAAGDNSGGSVSLSADGSTVAIGAFENGDSSGHVRVYQNVGGSWSQIGNDIDGEDSGDWSGWSVTLSANGNTVAIGAPGHFGGKGNWKASFTGYVRVYQNMGGSWSQIGNDINGETTGHASGVSVSLSSDGNTVAIGDHVNSGNGLYAGHVRVYRNVAGSWSQIGSDIDGTTNMGIGWSVSLSADGATLAIGSPFNDGFTGHVRVYQNVAGNWSQIGNDIDGEAAGDFCGGSISISSDGTTLAIGATGNAGNGTESGHVRVYSISGSTTTQVIAPLKRELLKITDLLGREQKATNQLLFYIYNDGTVEKKVVIE